MNTNAVFMVMRGELREPAHIVELSNNVIAVVPMHASLLDPYLIITFYRKGKKGNDYDLIETTPELLAELQEKA